MSFYIHESSFVDLPSKIGDGTKIWHFSHIQSNSVIGENCVLGQNVNVGSGAVIGNFVKIQNNVSVYQGVELEDYVFCGPSVVFTNVRLPRSKFPVQERYVKTVVKEGASIGANATIICGTTIGKCAMIGAGSVVTRDVSNYALIRGVPGVQVGWVSEAGDTLVFDKSGLATCRKTNTTYRLEGSRVVTVK